MFGKERRPSECIKYNGLDEGNVVFIPELSNQQSGVYITSQQFSIWNLIDDFHLNFQEK
jgi:hypothetical protein